MNKKKRTIHRTTIGAVHFDSTQNHMFKFFLFCIKCLLSRLSGYFHTFIPYRCSDVLDGGRHRNYVAAPSM